MLFPLLVALAGDPVALDFEPEGVFDAIPSSMLMNVARMSPERPEAITVEPAYENEPLYLAMGLGDGDTVIHLALDESPERAALYIDANGNGDLTDDVVVEARRQVIPPEQRTPILKVWIFDHFEASIPVRYHDGSQETLSITFRTYGRECRDLNAIPPDLVFWSRYYRHAEVDIGGSTYAVAVKDQNADGRFDTLKDESHPWADRVYIDLNADGIFQPRGEGYAIDAPFEVEGVVYEVKRISPSGSEIAIGPSAREFTPTTLRVGQVAPDFEIEGAGRLSDLRGRVVLVDFWATWCVPCLAEMPSVVRVRERFGDRGFQVVGVSIDRAADGERMREVARDKAMAWPQVHDPDQAIARRYFVTSIPATFLVGADGRILASYLSGEELDEWVERAVSEVERAGDEPR